MDENQCYLRFEYTSGGYTTVVVKYYEEGDTRQFDALMSELRMCLLASGFSENLVNEYIPPL